MRSASYIAAAAALVAPAFAQTFTDCNPLDKTCPSDPALGKSVAYDFTKGAPSDFTAAAGTPPKFTSEGGVFSISAAGQAPTLSSNWYFMFGHMKVVMKPAPGQGIVSSLVLESNDLDEVDWEWVGSESGIVQTNYFGKGNTTVYDRGANFQDPKSSTGFNTYELDWTSEHIQWIINGNVVRTLTPATAHPGQYPQTPMQLKIGNWPAGDSPDAGTVSWAGGKVDYSKGPFNMIVKSIEVSDYSTGKSYSYGDHSGDWESIVSDGGKVNANGAVPENVSTASASGTTLTAKPTASQITGVAQVTTQAVPTGQFGNGGNTGVATVTPGSNATVGMVPTTSGTAGSGGAAPTGSSSAGSATPSTQAGAGAHLVAGPLVAIVAAFAALMVL